VASAWRLDVRRATLTPVQQPNNFQVSSIYTSHTWQGTFLIPYLAAHPTLTTVGTADLAVVWWALSVSDSHPLSPQFAGSSASLDGLRAKCVSLLQDLAIHLRAASSSSADPQCMLYLERGWKREISRNWPRNLYACRTDCYGFLDESE
jgi:hypothetical protein